MEEILHLRGQVSKLEKRNAELLLSEQIGKPRGSRNASLKRALSPCWTGGKAAEQKSRGFLSASLTPAAAKGKPTLLYKRDFNSTCITESLRAGSSLFTPERREARKSTQRSLQFDNKFAKQQPWGEMPETLPDETLHYSGMLEGDAPIFKTIEEASKGPMVTVNMTTTSVACFGCSQVTNNHELRIERAPG